MVTKKDIRKYVLNRRNNISKTEWETYSKIIYDKVVTHSFFLESDTIYCYIDYSNEVGTRNIIEKAWSLGKRVAVPKIHGEEMNFHLIHNFEELKSGYKGIMEPVTPRIDDIEKGLVIVPGVAFDRHKNRIGYGKGFYDRFLKQHSDLKTMAIAFEIQIVEKITAEEHDFKPQIMITEEQIYV